MVSIRSGIARRCIRALGPVLMGMAVCGASAQVELVAPTYTGFFASSAPTATFLFEAPGAPVTLVFIPGGEGHVGMKPGMTAEHRYLAGYQFNLMLRSLAERDGVPRMNLVIFDSPVELPTSNHWSGARTQAEHLSRVEDVVRHYRERLGKPVWLMGHSMGSISVTETAKRLDAAGRLSMLAGLIVSGGQTGTSLPYDTLRLPVLLLHHERDACVGNTLGHAQRLHERLRAAGNTAAELAVVQGGRAAADNPNVCRSGFHMYLGAEDEAATAIRGFVGRHLAAK